MWANSLERSARKAAAERQARILRNATTDARRLTAADHTFANGDTRVAIMIYVRLALARPPSASTWAARERLAYLRNHARQKLEELETSLSEGGADQEPTGDAPPVPFYANGQRIDSRWAATVVSALQDIFSEAHPPIDALVLVRPARIPGHEDDHVIDVFEQFDELIRDYGELPAVGNEIKRRVTTLRRRPEYAAALNEPAAAALWAEGQEYERADELCCAYWVYQEAVELLPAPSAHRARQRFEELSADACVVASAKTCRDLQWCHEMYQRAEQLLKGNPGRARELFGQIVLRAPSDSLIYRAAQQYIE